MKKGQLLDVLDGEVVPCTEVTLTSMLIFMCSSSSANVVIARIKVDTLFIMFPMLIGRPARMRVEHDVIKDRLLYCIIGMTSSGT